jgi:hypothetical protein
MFKAASFHKAKNWKQSKCSLQVMEKQILVISTQQNNTQL